MVMLKKPSHEVSKSKTQFKLAKKHNISKAVCKQELQKPKLKEEKGVKNLKKKSKYVMPSKYINEKVVESCLNVLYQLKNQNSSKKNMLLDDDIPIFLEINCIKIQNVKGNLKFVLPYSTFASTGEVCLITPDLKKGQRADHEPTIDHWEELLRKSDVTSVKTILPMRQLRVEYDQFELKRRLLTQHDFIMVDTRVLSHVSHLLGKMFFNKHNMLIPVRINESKLKESIDQGLKTAVLRLNLGATSTVTVGHVGMSQQDVKENVLALVNQLKEKYPGGEANIRSLALKLPFSLSLPLYITLRPTSAVIAPKLRHQKPKNFAICEGELSTIPGSTVKVAPDGTVQLQKSEALDSDMEADDSKEKKEDSE